MKRGPLTEQEAKQLVKEIGRPSENPLTFAEEGVCIFALVTFHGGVRFQQDLLYWMQPNG